MKIGIITCIDYTNYGNRLQNYALNLLLKEQGFVVKSGLQCDIKSEWEKDESSLKRVFKRICPFFVYKFHKKSKLKNDSALMKKRKENFIKFSNNYIDTFPYVCVRNVKELRKRINEPSFDFFVAGSDQIWNPYFEGKNFEFLTFTDPHKRLSFAASFGVDKIPKSQIGRYKKNLSQMKLISVREEQSISLVNSLCGRLPEYTLDPTLLLSKNDWKKISKRPNIDLEEKYICTYFLGETPSIVKSLAYERKLPIYELNEKNAPNFFIIDPAEFVYMISHASMIFTDSFHAAAFSIIFHRDFYIFKRKQKGVNEMFGRLVSLTDFFDLSQRIQSEENFSYQPLISTDHWRRCDDKRKYEKEKAMQMLLHAMN